MHHNTTTPFTEDMDFEQVLLEQLQIAKQELTEVNRQMRPHLEAGNASTRHEFSDDAHDDDDDDGHRPNQQRYSHQRSSSLFGQNGAGRNASTDGGNQRRWNAGRPSADSSSSSRGYNHFSDAPTKRLRRDSTSNDRSDRGSDRYADADEQTASAMLVPATTTRPASAGVSDEATKRRNQRLFGNLIVGTLKQFQQQSSSENEKTKKREEILSKVDERNTKKSQEILEEMDKLMKEKQKKLRTVRKLEARIAFNIATESLNSHHKAYRNFIKTSASPAVFYLPAKMTDKTARLLEESQKRVDDELVSTLKKLADKREALMAKLDGNAVDEDDDAEDDNEEPKPETSENGAGQEAPSERAAAEQDSEKEKGPE